MSDKSLGIYVHIPFCVRKCAYCDFYSIAQNEETEEDYVDALVAQIRRFRSRGKGRYVDTIYIGGGTPSILPADDIADILNAIRTNFTVVPDAEITMEANPGTITGEKLAVWRVAGVNRLSIGMQSANNHELRRLSRIHTQREFEEAYSMARMEGFDNINIDVMYGLPNQTEERLAQTMEYVFSLDPEHISFYGLKIEENTPFGSNPDIIKALPDENTQVRMYGKNVAAMLQHGFLQYEISNFAKPGFSCKHNLKYWHSRDYLGFGPAAASYFDGHLYSYVKDVNRFIHVENDDSLIDETETQTVGQQATQYVMMAFRTSTGVDAQEYASRFGLDFEEKYGERLIPFIQRDYIEKIATGYRLTLKGMLVSNRILSEILDFDDV